MSLKQHLAQEEMKLRCAAARATLLQPKYLNDEVWNEAFGENSFDLEDGRARIFALNRFGHLIIYKRVRMDEAWLQPLVKEVKNFKEMAKLHGKAAKRVIKSPTYFRKVVVAVPEWDKGLKQFKVELEGEVKLTFWFCAEYIKALNLEGWVLPHKQNQGIPWNENAGIIKGKSPGRMFVPILSREEEDMLLKGNTSEVIRRLHLRHAKDLEERVFSRMDIKEAIDTLLKAVASFSSR